MSPYSLDHISLRSYVLLAPRAAFCFGARGDNSPSTNEPKIALESAHADSVASEAQRASPPQRPLAFAIDLGISPKPPSGSFS